MGRRLSCCRLWVGHPVCAGCGCTCAVFPVSCPRCPKIPEVPVSTPHVRRDTSGRETGRGRRSGKAGKHNIDVIRSSAGTAPHYIGRRVSLQTHEAVVEEKGARGWRGRSTSVRNWSQERRGESGRDSSCPRDLVTNVCTYTAHMTVENPQNNFVSKTQAPMSPAPLRLLGPHDSGGRGMSVVGLISSLSAPTITQESGPT